MRIGFFGGIFCLCFGLAIRGFGFLWFSFLSDFLLFFGLAIRGF